MKKQLIIALAMVMGGGTALAAPLTPSQALSRMWKSGLMPSATRSTSGKVLRRTERMSNGVASLYVFSDGNDSGYVILSADDVAQPVLGYTTAGNFDSSNVSPELQYWLDEYTRQIEYAVSQNAGSTGVGVESRAVSASKRVQIPPLCTTQWNQDSPYNDECPGTATGVKYPSGCVATCMAQVMKRWNYPASGTGSGNATFPSGSTGTSTALLKRIPLDWGNMIDIYKKGEYTAEQGLAVANLMKACGYASQMNYNTGGSGTLARYAAKGLINNFSYNPNIEYHLRDSYSVEEWDSMVYEELAAGRPIMYGGVSKSVGHEFVCDGYAGEGFYHFNWGWGGSSDGYFMLGALSPGAVGIGGGDGKTGYNWNQDIITKIQPTETPATAPIVTQLGELVAKVNGMTINLTLEMPTRSGLWVNTGFRDIQFEYGAEISRINGGGSEYIALGSTSINAPTITRGDGSYSISYTGLNGYKDVTIPESLADGVYRLQLVSKLNGGDARRNFVGQDGVKTYLYFSKSGKSVSVLSEAPMDCEITEAATLTNVYYGALFKGSVTLKNPGTTDNVYTLCPVLVKDGVLQMVGDKFSVAAKAGETLTHEFVSGFNLQAEVEAPTSMTSYEMHFMDVNTQAIDSYIKTVRMRINNGAVYTATYSLANAVEGTETLSGSEVTVYSLPNPNEIGISAEIENTGTYFGYNVCAVLSTPANSNQPLASTLLGPSLILTTPGEKGNMSGTLQYSGANAGEIYQIQLYLQAPSGMQLIKDAGVKYVKFATSGICDLLEASGVRYDRDARELTVDSGSQVEVYSLSGLRIGETSGGVLKTDQYGRGLAIVVVRKADGTVFRMKLSL